MAITFPSNSDTDLYAYLTGDTGSFSFTFETTPTASDEMDIDSIQDDDVIMVLVAKDDDGGVTWMKPTSIAGITSLAGTSGTYSEIFSYNDSNRDEAMIIGWAAVVTDASSLATATSHQFQTADTGEEISWVAVIVRGTDVSGSTVAAWLDSVTPQTGQTQDTNAPDPPGVTTNTNGAVVVTLTGHSQNARHLGADASTYAFLVTPPSGYTIESDTNGIVGGTDSQANHPYGAPGRTQMGVGNGDAQMSWAHKTVATAGSENPGAWGGFQTTRDHKYVTFAIKPAATGTNYDETGRSVSVTATVTATDTLTHHYTENRTAAVTATVTGTDQADFTNDVAVNIAATVAATDDRTLTDENVSVAVTSSVAATDAHNLYYDETGRTVSVAATVTASDVQHYAVDGLTVAVTASVAATDDRTLTDENVVVAIIATVDATDVEPGVNYDETGRVVNIIGAVAATDDHNIAYDETGRVVAITATVTATDDRTLTAENVTVAATSNVTSSDTADYTDAVTVAVTAAVFGTDQLTQPGAYEEDVSVAIAATVTGTDTADFSDALTVAVTGAVAATDAWATSEDVSVAISSSVAPTDQFDATEAVAVAVVGSTAASDVVSSVEALSVPVTATVNATDDYTPTEQLVEDVSVTIISSVAATDLAAYVEAGVVDIVATIAATDSEVEDYGENVTVAIVSTVTAGDTAAWFDATTLNPPVYYGPTSDITVIGDMNDDAPHGDGDGSLYDELTNPGRDRYVEIPMIGASDTAAGYFQLPNIEDPKHDAETYMVIDLTHMVAIDIGGTAITGSFVLRQGDTSISTQFPSGNGDDWRLNEIELTPAQTAGITDWNDLNVAISFVAGSNHVGTDLVKLGFIGIRIPTAGIVATVVATDSLNTAEAALIAITAAAAGSDQWTQYDDALVAIAAGASATDVAALLDGGSFALSFAASSSLSVARLHETRPYLRPATLVSGDYISVTERNINNADNAHGEQAAHCPPYTGQIAATQVTRKYSPGDAYFGNWLTEIWFTNGDISDADATEVVTGSFTGSDVDAAGWYTAFVFYRFTPGFPTGVGIRVTNEGSFVGASDVQLGGGVSDGTTDWKVAALQTNVDAGDLVGQFVIRVEDIDGLTLTEDDRIQIGATMLMKGQYPITEPFHPSHRIVGKQVHKYRMGSHQWAHPTQTYQEVAVRYTGSIGGYLTYLTQSGGILHATYDGGYDHVLGATPDTEDDARIFYNFETEVDPATGEYAFRQNGVTLEEGIDTPNPWTILYEDRDFSFLRFSANNLRVEYFQIYDDELLVLDLQATDAPGGESAYAEWLTWTDSVGNEFEIVAPGGGLREGGLGNREVNIVAEVTAWDNWYMLLEHDTAGIGTASGETEPNRAVSDDELADAVGGERGTATSNLPRPGRVT